MPPVPFVGGDFKGFTAGGRGTIVRGGFGGAKEKVVDVLTAGKVSV